MVFEYHSLNLIVFANLGASLNYAFRYRFREPERYIMALEVLPDLRVKNITTGEIYPCVKNFYFFNDKKENSFYVAQKNMDTDKTIKGLSCYIPYYENSSTLMPINDAFKETPWYKESGFKEKFGW